MKMVSLIALTLAASGAFAAPSKKMSCASIKGQKPVISYQISEDSSRDWEIVATMKINGFRGEVSDQVSSNDAGGEIDISLSDQTITASAFLTSDDETDMSAELASVPGSIKLSAGSDEKSGSAKFQGKLTGSVSKGSKVKSAKNSKVNCSVSWKISG